MIMPAADTMARYIMILIESIPAFLLVRSCKVFEMSGCRMDLNHRPEKLLSPTELRQPGLVMLSYDHLLILRDFHEIANTPGRSYVKSPRGSQAFGPARRVSDENRPLNDKRLCLFSRFWFRFRRRCHVRERSPALLHHLPSISSGQGDCPHNSCAIRNQQSRPFSEEIRFCHDKSSFWVTVRILSRSVVAPTVEGLGIPGN